MKIYITTNVQDGQKRPDMLEDLAYGPMNVYLGLERAQEHTIELWKEEMLDDRKEDFTDNEQRELIPNVDMPMIEAEIANCDWTWHFEHDEYVRYWWLSPDGRRGMEADRWVNIHEREIVE